MEKSFKQKLKEWASVYVAKSPRKAILVTILLFNVLFFFIATAVIYLLAPPSLSECSYWDTLFYTITMVLDAGCVQFIVADASHTSAIIIIICLVVIVVGMIMFTGAIIGYVSNYISSYIESSNQGKREINVSNHTIILNWNSRGAEIINDLLYSEEPETVVVLVDNDREAVEYEINMRVAETVERENNNLRWSLADKPFWVRHSEYKKRSLQNKLTYMVKEGDTFSTKQLMDVSVSKAKSIIILEKNRINTECRYNVQEQVNNLNEGNIDIIKTLVLVADMTAALDSADDQRIVVEAEDDWTLSIINEIIEHKQKLGKCNIIPVSVNRMLGQIMSQFSLMPELNLVYQTLFSNKGASFFCKQEPIPEQEDSYFTDYLQYHREAIPLGFYHGKEADFGYYMTDTQESIDKTVTTKYMHTDVALKEYIMPKKKVVILGHNSKVHYIMEGFNSFRDEWGHQKGVEGDIMNILVIDEEDSLKRQNYYSEYPQVTKTAAVSIFDKQTILDEIEAFIEGDDDVSILILSDDLVPAEQTDGSALVYLIYVQEIMKRYREAAEGEKKNHLEVVVEILDPKNTDVARSYSANNVVISNRYVSKMMTQLSEKIALFEFYADILTYDEEGAEEKGGYSSREVYAKRVGDFFEYVPAECTPASLIRAVYAATPDYNRHIVLGYVEKNGKIHLFDGNQQAYKFQLCADDKLIVFAPH